VVFERYVGVKVVVDAGAVDVDRREGVLLGREGGDKLLVRCLEAAAELGNGGTLALDERLGGAFGRGEVVLVDGSLDPREELLVQDGDLLAADLVQVAAVEVRVELACGRKATR
jgi:hypothetical protein